MAEKLSIDEKLYLGNLPVGIVGGGRDRLGDGLSEIRLGRIQLGEGNFWHLSYRLNDGHDDRGARYPGAVAVFGNGKDDVLAGGRWLPGKTEGLVQCAILSLGQYKVVGRSILIKIDIAKDDRSSRA